MLNNKQKKVVLSMSGGVDSSVSAVLLKQQGYQVEGLFMKNWEEDDTKEYCSSSIDLKDAHLICKKLDIVLHTVNFSNEYWNNVFKDFLLEYKLGQTPNPDVICNREIKFKVFLKFAIEHLKADFIATGHYVRRVYCNGEFKLLRGIDQRHDQSYFLYMLNQEQISKCLFPVGSFNKSQVRKIAIHLNLPNALKKSSTGICFIGKRKFANFIGNFLKKKPGKIINAENNKIIGIHKGLICYTLGQRKGLGIGGISQHVNKEPWYVVDKDMINNYLIVSQGNTNPRLMSIGVTIKHIYLINHKFWNIPLCCTVKTRYQQQDTMCKIQLLSNDRLQVSFDHPIKAVTPGQSAVFYLLEQCLGGGIIEARQLLNI